MNKILSYIPGRGKSVVRIVRLQGAIKVEGPRSLNLRRMERFIDKAFDIRRVKPQAVCLEINSAGGTVVQSNLIYERIRYLSEDTGVPVLSFAEEYAASGGYWLAMAGDEIYVDPNSMVGSIGVIFGNFGFEETMKKLGLEWRLITAGKNKFRMDPFTPLKQEDVDFTTKRLHKIHSNFIELVKKRRKKIDVNHKTIFTGEAFSGTDAVSIGLADGFYTDLRGFCKERYGKDVKFERCEPSKGFLEKFQGLGTKATIDVSINDLLVELAEQQQKAKLGL
ncbi:Na(+)/H(+) antiporter NhaA-like [Acropora muricata]|uniref:Na(+)/H(+) antiporter NhaA-like n=1 Tax=Acropora millepora TaxID=45264 RepID=UPI001CF48702|nr:Na(+)/H(+) antiporter NhaA-like [Acropora millepora]